MEFINKHLKIKFELGYLKKKNNIKYYNADFIAFKV